MSANGLAVFDKTLQTTHIWLEQIMKRIGQDRQTAWKALSVVLHKLRDRIPVEAAAHWGAQLPILVRGIYYDQYQPGKQPTTCRTREEFVAEVREWIGDTQPVDAEQAIRTIFDTLSRNIDPGEVNKVRHLLPEAIRNLWSDAHQPA